MPVSMTYTKINSPVNSFDDSTASSLIHVCNLKPCLMLSDVNSIYVALDDSLPKTYLGSR